MTEGERAAAFPGVGQTTFVSQDGRSQVVANYAPGMTLRQWYAGMALQGLVTRNGATGFENLAAWAFQQADAMLEYEISDASRPAA